MDYFEICRTTDGVLLQKSAHFNLGQTLDCGQSFRWRRCDDNTYEGIAWNRYLRLSRRGEHILLHDITLDEFDEFWCDYFDLGRDYGELKQRLCGDPVLRRAIGFAPGIRVLRQHPWEALCSFILSQNNNVARIKGLVERLCESFGEAVPGGHAFPTADRLAGLSVDDLAPVRCGFRAKYLLDAARRVANGELALEPLHTLPISEARAQLMQIYGVGPKVADCALLYGFGRVECVPVDVWISRVLAQLYPNGFPQQFASVAGIAQQYLFHYARCCPNAFNTSTATL